MIANPVKRLKIIWRIIANLFTLIYRYLKWALLVSFHQAERATGGSVGILIFTLHSFNRARATQAAASIAYYALFSLFPLLLLLVTFGTTVLKNQEIMGQVLAYTSHIFPTTQGLIQRNVEQVLALRGTVGMAAVVGLLWAATGVFDSLARNINMAWQDAEQRNFLERRMVGLMIIIVLGTLPFLSIISSAIFRLLPSLTTNLPLWGDTVLYETLSWQIFTRLTPWLLIFFMFLSLYRWVPTVEVRWSEAIWGALLAASAWEITKFGFTWFLSSGLVHYQLVYGSLGTVIALLLWIYLSSVIILFGAHLSAAMTHYHKHRPRTEAES